jgi:glycine betaine/proline transport system substrate-binding protein
MKRWLLPGLGIAATAFLALMMIACTSSSAPAASSNKPVIKMALNDWLGAELDDTVAQILLQEQLHYPDVELIDAGTSDQFGSIASGALHVSLEVWPSGHPDEIQQYITDQKSIEDIGLLGPVGQVGWFMPTYVLTLHPELATWEGLENASDVALFATPATTPKGQFVGGDPTWVQWDPQLITNLGLDFTEVWAGSESGILADLDTAYKARAPLLFYFYQPHWAFAAYDLSQVQLPPYAATCWAVQKCSYPADNLFKMVWPPLKTYAPDAYAFFQAFSYTTEDQTQMMNAVQNGQTVQQAARAWIDSHQSVWGPWIPKGE